MYVNVLIYFIFNAQNLDITDQINSMGYTAFNVLYHIVPATLYDNYIFINIFYQYLISILLSLLTCIAVAGVRG